MKAQALSVTNTLCRKLLFVSGAWLSLAAAADAPVDPDVDLQPLKDARTLQFTTDEGTWISLDVTPDGRHLVFELLGDLYRLPIQGGTAQRITQGVAYDAQPRVSPDGRWIAFVSDRSGADQLWIARIDGSEPRKLSDVYQNVVSPAWWPDSQYVVATVNGQLTLYNIDGGSGVQLSVENFSKPPSAFIGERTMPLGAAVSRDGKFLYFARRMLSDTKLSRSDFQIHRRDMESGEVDLLTQRLGGAFRPALSPDGRQMVYATRYENKTGLRLLDVESGADRWLIYPVQRDNAEEGAEPSRDVFPGYAFTPDGRSIIVTSGGKIQRVEIASGRAGVIPFTAQVSLQIGPSLDTPYRLEEGPVQAKIIQSPRQSPDGKRLAFSALTHIYVMDLPDGKPRRLTPADTWEYQPAWSPDGRSIVYVSWGQEGGHLWKMNADGRGKPQRLTQEPAYYSEPVVSPDGKEVVALRGSARSRQQGYMQEELWWEIPRELVRVQATGGEVHRVAPSASMRGPHFCAGSERICVYSLDKYQGDILSMRLDGSDRRTHLRLGSSPGTPTKEKSAYLSPDGRWAMALMEYQLQLIGVPQVGGEGPAFTLDSPQLPAKRFTSLGPDYFSWADGGKTLTWAVGSTFYRRSLASVKFGLPVTDEKPAESDDAVEAIHVKLEFPRAKPHGTLVLRHATIITMEGEKIVADGDILVRDNRFAALGRSGEVAVPAGARVIDMSGKFIVPGFIDTHAHWPFKVHDVLEPPSWALAANLAYGVTTGLDVQAPADTFAYQDLSETGRIVGQRILTTGPGVLGASGPATNNFKSYEQLRNFLRRYTEHYRTHNLKSYLVGDRQRRQWMVRACRELGLMPTTEGHHDMKMDLTHALDGFHGNEHFLSAMPLYKDVVELFARSRTSYTPTLIVTPGAENYFFTAENVYEDAKLSRFVHHNFIDFTSRRRTFWARPDEYLFDEAARQAAKIQRAGGLIGVGAHGELQGLGYHWEMWALGTGMQPREVLQAATIDGAHIIGVAQDLGSITVGKVADLVVLDKNPLQDIRNTNTVRYVMKNGALYEGDTLKQLWPKEQAPPPFWWWDRP